MNPELASLSHNFPESPGSGRIGAWRYPALAALAASVLGLSLWNIAQTRAVQRLQAEIDSGRQYLDQTVPLAQLNEKIIARLAQLSVGKGDEALKRLLAEQGVTFTVDEPSKPAAGESAPVKSK